MDIIKKGIVYDRNYQLVVGVILLCSAAALLYFLPDAAEKGARFTVYFVSMILLVLAAIFIYNAGKKVKPEKELLVRYLEFDPKQIVWVYSYVVQTMPFGIHFMKMTTVYFYYLDGNYTTIRVNGKVHNELMEELKGKLPHASFGFTSEKEQLYKANPALLYKEDE
ncbi:MAG: hypothetical protein WD048_03355 [Chitinophagales bacterium]